jgi:hypothetical protein
VGFCFVLRFAFLRFLLCLVLGFFFFLLRGH